MFEVKWIFQLIESCILNVKKYRVVPARCKEILTMFPDFKKEQGNLKLIFLRIGHVFLNILCSRLLECYFSVRWIITSLPNDNWEIMTFKTKNVFTTCLLGKKKTVIFSRYVLVECRCCFWAKTHSFEINIHIFCYIFCLVMDT